MTVGLQHDALPRAVGRISAPSAAGRVEGTCFLVTPNRALTCAHCLRGPQGERLESGKVTFTQVLGSPSVAFRSIVDELDPAVGLDVAVLELSGPVEGTASLPLSPEDPSSKPTWQSFGHPKSIAYNPLWLGGTVDGRIARYAAGTEGWLLSLSTEGNLSEIEGMSGSPILTDHGVVGILSHQLYKREREGAEPAPGFSKTFAVPTRFLLSLPSFSRALKTSSSVFIAYRRNGREAALVKELRSQLTRAGHNAFIDVDMEVGDDWAVRLRDTIVRAQFFVVVLTEESVESPMLVNEIKTAYRQSRYTGRPIILPIRDATLRSLPFEVETYLGQLQYAPWAGEAHTPETSTAIVSAVTRQVAELPAEPSPEAGRTPPPPSMNAPLRVRAASNALPLTDPLYAAREGDAEGFDRVDGDRFALAILGPSGFGKTSLAIRLTKKCTELGRPVATIDFRGFGQLPEDDGVHNGYVTFLNDFARILCRSLKLPLPTSRIEDPEDVLYLLEPTLRAQPRLVILMDGADKLVWRSYGVWFLMQCRSLMDDVTQTVSFIFCISTEPQFLIPNTSASPFNVGDQMPVELVPFDRKVLRTLLNQGRLALDDPGLEIIYHVTGGHPLLTRQALVHVFGSRPATDPGDESLRGDVVVRRRLEDLEARCGDINGGPFSAHLRTLLDRLEKPHNPPPSGPKPPTPLAVLKKVVREDRGFRPDASEERVLRKLMSLGVVRQVRDARPWYQILGAAYATFVRQRP
jgi:hypothetical protein